MEKRVREVMNERVRPRLQEHFGDIELIGVEDGVVSVRLYGACSGCPSAKFTLEDIVLTELQAELPEITEVALIQEVSQDLLDMARKILDKKI